MLPHCFAGASSLPRGNLNLKRKSGNSLILPTEGGKMEPIFQGKMNCGCGSVCAPESSALFTVLMHLNSICDFGQFES